VVDNKVVGSSVVNDEAVDGAMARMSGPGCVCWGGGGSMAREDLRTLGPSST
jgi:hypothetical protein